MEKPFPVQGVLYVRKPRRSWKKKWCELKDDIFFMYSIASRRITAHFSVGEISNFGEVHLDHSSKLSQISGPSYIFQIVFADTVNRVYFGTFSQKALQQWVDAVQQAQLFYRDQYRIRKKLEQNLMWSKIWTSDTNRPKGRYFHTLTDPIVVASHEEEVSNSNVKSCSMWMYGGKTSKNTYLNELWELHFPNADENRIIWIKPDKLAGGSPVARAGHSTVIYGKYLFVFGGKNSKELLNDLHTFHTEHKIWSQPMFEGTPPSPRYCHTATVVGNKMYIVGGKGKNQVYSDIYSLDLDMMRWERIEANRFGPAPRGLQKHSTTLVGENVLFIFGGMDSGRVISNQLWIFDLTLAAWSSPTSERGVTPVPRYGHVASLVGRNIFISGGKSFDGGINDVCYLCTKTLIWYNSTTNGEDQPKPRWGHCSSQINNTQFSYGGKKESGNPSFDVYALTTKPLEQQWIDFVSRENIKQSCCVCSEESSTSGNIVLKLLSANSVIHTSCLDNRLMEYSNTSNSNILSEVLSLTSKSKTDIEFLIDFIRHIFQNDSHPLYLNLVKFSVEFNSEYASISEEFKIEYYGKALREIQVYLNYFNSMVLQNVKLLDYTNGKYQSLMIINSALVPLIYHPLLSLFQAKFLEEDTKYEQNIERLSTLSISSFLTLDIPMDTTDGKNPFELSIKILQQIPLARSAVRKADIFHLVRHSIVFCIRNFYTNTEDKKLFISADDTIPLLQYIIVKSNVENLVSELQFTKTMLGDNIDGELGYCFTSFEIALYSLDRIEVQ